MKATFIALALGVAVALLVFGVTVAGETQGRDRVSGEEINWQVVSNGGTDGSSPNYLLQGTTSQTAVGSGTSTNYGANHGYWQDFAGGGGPDYLCGDCNADQLTNITDAVYLIQYIFNGGPAPNPLVAGDANCDTLVNITDAVYLIQFIFNGGPYPCDPDDDGEPDC